MAIDKLRARGVTVHIEFLRLCLGKPVLMIKEAAHTGRIIVFSDGVFAVIIIVLVLELLAPVQATFAALHDFIAAKGSAHD
jgi:hypothetical protein